MAVQPVVTGLPAAVQAVIPPERSTMLAKPAAAITLPAFADRTPVRQ